MTLQIVASLIDAARGVIYDRHMFIVQATDDKYSSIFCILVIKMQNKLEFMSPAILV